MNRATTALLATVAVALAACGGDGSTGPDLPDASGTYNGSWTFNAENLETGQTASSECPGSVTLTVQDGGALEGSYLINDGGDCDQTTSGGVATGTLRSDGGVTFRLTSSGSDPFQARYDCTVVASDEAMTGRVDGSELTASQGTTYDCDGTRLEVTAEFVGRR